MNLLITNFTHKLRKYIQFEEKKKIISLIQKFLKIPEYISITFKKASGGILVSSGCPRNCRHMQSFAPESTGEKKNTDLIKKKKYYHSILLLLHFSLAFIFHVISFTIYFYIFLFFDAHLIYKLVNMNTYVCVVT